MNTNDKMESQKQNIGLALAICFQSFIPLLIILLIKHFDFKFIEDTDMVWYKNFWNIEFLKNNWTLLVIYTIYIFFLLWGLRTNRKLKKLMKKQDKGGVSISITDIHEKQSLSYFLTYLLPLIGDTPSDIKGLLSFSVLFFIIVFCVFKENLFFDNIILNHFFGYQVFDFECEQTNEKGVGITKKEIPNINQNIRYQRIYKNVYYIEVIKK